MLYVHAVLVTMVTDKIYQEEDMQFVQECIGNVVGMRHFLWSMKGTSGEVLFWFWLDVERLHRVTPSGTISILTAKLFNLNFHPLEVVSR